MAGAMKARIDALRKRSPFVDHVIAMVEHYSKVEGSLLAGAVTYFGFLSFFPLLALGFAVVGYISGSYPDARDHLVTAIEQIFPNIVSKDGAGNTISLHDIENARAAAGIIGFVGVLYSGLNWVSGLRNALETAFQVPKVEQPKLLVGKLIDLGALILIGLILVVSVGIAGIVEAAAGNILDSVGLSGSTIGRPLIWTIGVLLGVAASTLLFFVMYKVLGRPEIPKDAIWRGAVFAAIAFEVLKVVVVNILGHIGGTSVASLAIAVTLVVWINYFSRITVYGASWAMTSKAAMPVASPGPRRLEADAVVETVVVEDDDVPARRGLLARFDAGSAVLGGLVGAAVAFILNRSSD